MAKKNVLDINNRLEDLNKSLKDDEQDEQFEKIVDKYCSILNSVSKLNYYEKEEISAKIADCLDKIYLKDTKTIHKVFHHAFIRTFESCSVAIFKYKQGFIQKDIDWCLDNRGDFKTSAESVCDLLVNEYAKSKSRASHLYVQIVLELNKHLEQKDSKQNEAIEYGKALFCDGRIEKLPSLGYCMWIGNIFNVRKTEKYRDKCLRLMVAK